MAKKVCIYCDNMIDSDCILCPICGASQDVELPEYGGGSHKDGSVNPGTGVIDEGRFWFDQNRPRIDGDRCDQGGTVLIKPEPSPNCTPVYLLDVSKEEDRISEGKKRLLIALTVVIVAALLTSGYFLVLVLTRNSFLDSRDKLKEQIPVYGYTINGSDYSELEIVSIERQKAEGFFSFEALYNVTLEDERMEHRLTLEIKGENVFPFGWRVTETNWTEKTQGEITVKINGISPIVQKLVEQGIPTHKVENFAIWVDQNRSSFFVGNCVISNPVGANYSIRGAYSYNGDLTLSSAYAQGVYDYILTVRRDTEKDLPVTYGCTKAVLKPVFTTEMPDGELRLQITKVGGERIFVEAFRTYTDGRATEYDEADAGFFWNVEPDPKTDHPIASDRISAVIPLFDSSVEVEVIIGPDSLVVNCGDYTMMDHMDMDLKPADWTDPAPSEEDLEDLDVVEG